ncbi:MAG TPA: ATP-binding protein, partial [Chitinophagaceae bacterium]|nr:ATP-binding protein [Chitinophagaceae bacterium]
MTTGPQNPYRGPFSYKEGDEDIFFGRNREVDELIDLIRKNQLTVLYGASGTGKTSLLHAKLLPQLKREYFHPIYIRINFANNEDPLHLIRKRIVDELRIWDHQIPEFHPDQSLLHYAAKNVIYKGLIKPVLFFDQFEELFTLGPKTDSEKIHRFMFQLSELIELRLPDDLKTLDYINNITNFKVVFSLRQDWIGFLDDFTQLIPSISEVRYRLK